MKSGKYSGPQQRKWCQLKTPDIIKRQGYGELKEGTGKKLSYLGSEVGTWVISTTAQGLLLAWCSGITLGKY